MNILSFLFWWSLFCSSIFLNVELSNEKKLETLEKSNEEENIKNILEKNNFNIIEVLDDSCIADIDCKTPAHYMIQSHCPYNSKCIKSKCSVICPSSFTGKIIDSNIIPMLD